MKYYKLAPYLHLLVAILGDRMFLTALGCTREAVQHYRSPSRACKRKKAWLHHHACVLMRTLHSVAYIFAQQASMAHVSYVYIHWHVSLAEPHFLRTHSSLSCACVRDMQAYCTFWSGLWTRLILYMYMNIVGNLKYSLVTTLFYFLNFSHWCVRGIV